MPSKKMKHGGKILVPLKSYAPRITVEKFPPKPTAEDELQQLKRKIERLNETLALAKDRLRRYREVVEDEVKFWEKGLQYGEWEGIEATKRRLSRLRGSLDYLGHAGFGIDEVVK